MLDPIQVGTDANLPPGRPVVIVHRGWAADANSDRAGAYWQDHDGAVFVLQKLKSFGRLRVLFADSAYGRNDLPSWVKQTFGWLLQTVLRPAEAAGFIVLPKRWIVERTFAWLARCRRHSKDYERTTESSEAMIYLTMIALMSRRLAAANRI